MRSRLTKAHLNRCANQEYNATDGFKAVALVSEATDCTSVHGGISPSSGKNCVSPLTGRTPKRKFTYSETQSMDDLQITQEIPPDLLKDLTPPRWYLKPTKLEQVRGNRALVDTTPLGSSSYRQPAGVIRCECSSERVEGRLVGE